MEDKKSPFDTAAQALGDEIAAALRDVPAWLRDEAQEIRLRAGSAISITSPRGQTAVGGTRPDRLQIEKAYVNLCGHSVYSHLSELCHGYITVGGGHRAGLGGTAVLDGGKVSAMRDISSINMRIARDINGCADELISLAFADHVCGLLICGAPGSGKTTLLRGLAAALSDGRAARLRVTLIDERGELAAVYRGEPQLSVGWCDILSGFPKGVGISQAVRCLSPEVIICDEIGSAEEAFAIADGLNAGAVVIATAHAASPGELMSRKHLVSLLDTGAFRKIIFLSSSKTPAKIEKIMEAQDLYENHRHYSVHHNERACRPGA